MTLVVVGHRLAVITPNIAVNGPRHRHRAADLLDRVGMLDRQRVPHPVAMVDVDHVSVLVPKDQDSAERVVDPEVDTPNLEPERRDEIDLLLSYRVLGSRE